MGESKRRKEILGESYGDKPPALTRDHDLEKHVSKFFRAWTDKISEEDEGEKTYNSPKEAFQAQKEDLEIWIKNYLEPYRPEDQETLVVALLIPWYEQLEDIGNETDSSQIVSDGLEWMFGGILLYQICRHYMSDENQKIFVEPLKEFYDMVLEDEEVEETDEAEEIDEEDQKAEEIINLMREWIEEVIFK